MTAGDFSGETISIGGHQSHCSEVHICWCYCGFEPQEWQSNWSEDFCYSDSVPLDLPECPRRVKLRDSLAKQGANREIRQGLGDWLAPVVWTACLVQGLGELEIEDRYRSRVIVQAKRARGALVVSAASSFHRRRVVSGIQDSLVDWFDKE